MSGTGGQFLERPVILSFDGKNVLEHNNWPVKFIWHGSNKYGETSKQVNCNDWEGSFSSSFGMASALKNLQLLDQQKVACDNRLIVLCIETTSALPKRKRRDVEDTLWEEEGEQQRRKPGHAKRTTEKRQKHQNNAPPYGIANPSYEESHSRVKANKNILKSKSNSVLRLIDSEKATKEECQDGSEHCQNKSDGFPAYAKPPNLIQDLYLI